jgi:hypothetical protein
MQGAEGELKLRQIQELFQSTQLPSYPFSLSQATSTRSIMSAQSALEYARSNCLALDHTAGDPLDFLLRSPLTLTKCDSPLPELDFSQLAVDLSEPKLQLSHQGGALLSESIRAPHVDIDWKQYLPERHRLRKLKIDEPLLAGDHEIDVHKFKQDASSYRDLESVLQKCPEATSAADPFFDAEWDEIESGDAARGLEQDLAAERLHTTRDALVRLSNTLQFSLTEDARAQILQGLYEPTAVKVCSKNP